MRKIFLLSAALMLIPFSTFAIEKPAEIGNTVHATSPVGQGTLKKLFMRVYDASFWSDSGDWKQTPYALTIRYDMDFTSEDLVDRTLSEMRHVTSLPDEQLEAYAKRLGEVLPNIKEGDTITAIATSPQTTVFYHNGKKLGQMVDADFGKAFFGIWLSPKTSEPEMRKQLLGAN